MIYNFQKNNLKIKFDINFRRLITVLVYKILHGFVFNGYTKLSIIFVNIVPNKICVCVIKEAI